MINGSVPSMKKNQIRKALLCAGIYLALLYLFMFFERSQGITFIKAVWYSLATLTTVGYGDVVPVSPEGMLIGAVFAILSTFFFAFLVGLVLSLMRGSLLPMIRMLRAGGRNWYIFEECTPRNRSIARNLRKEKGCSLIIFANTPADQNEWNSLETDEDRGPAEFGQNTPSSINNSSIRNSSIKNKTPEIHTTLTTEAVIRRAADKSRCLVFCMDDNGFSNYQRAATLLDSGVKVSCLSEIAPDHVPSSLILFNPYISCARQYWGKYPVRRPDEKIIMIGSGKYAEALLEQALTVNVLHPDQQIQYLVYGDWGEFRLNHPYLSQVCTWGDSLNFASQPWNSDHEALKAADRIILCCDDERETLAIFSDLHRYVPISAAVYARLSQETNADMICFGSPDELLTPENVLHRRLEEMARTMHEIYLTSNNLTSPSWEELDAFKRRSNLASADHIATKVRILLGEQSGPELTQEILDAAFAKWQEEWPQKKEFFRRIEHERWMRFHLMNNWQFNAVRDDRKRLHSSILPFESLDEREQAKDDYAWELIGELRNRGSSHV